MRGLAPAKLNLYLEVVRRRPDGYHDLRTLFRTVAWGDEVEAGRTDAEGVACEVEGADLPTDDRNLAVRAARAWLAEARVRGGARVRLVKRVPAGGGLGGGSSDAAAVLRLLDAQAGPAALGAAALEAIARGLGSDVPFLLRGGACVGEGRGEVLRPVTDAGPCPGPQVVLVLPPFGTSTAAVYARAAERGPMPPPDGLDRAVEAMRSGVPSRLRGAHHNDLALPAMRAFPELARFAAEVERRLARPPCLTGSGSALFDVPDEGEAPAVLARLEGLPGRRVLTRLDGAATR